MVTLWDEPPKMDIGSPDPGIRMQDGAVWLSYRISRRPDHFAVVRFVSVTEWTMGPPSDERLATHPLWGRDLEPYAFHEVKRVVPGGRRWVITFHDETLDVTAREAEVVVRAIQARDAESALSMVLS